MASHMSRSAAKTCTDYAIEVNSYEQQLQTNEEFVMAFLDLHKDVRNNTKLFEFVDNYYVNTPDFCAALQQRLFHQEEEASSQGVSDDHFFHDLSFLFRQHLMMRVTLQSFGNSSDEKLDRIDTWKKVSAVFFTAAAAIAATAAAANANTKKPAAAAAAAASILLVALGKWIHSLLRKRESAVKKHKEIIGVMIIGAKITIKDLSNIYVLSRRLQNEIESISEAVDDGKKVAAVKKSFEKLRGKANDYSRNLNWTRQVVLQSINNAPNYGN